MSYIPIATGSFPMIQIMTGEPESIPFLYPVFYPVPAGDKEVSSNKLMRLALNILADNDDVSILYVVSHKEPDTAAFNERLENINGKLDERFEFVWVTPSDEELGLDITAPLKRIRNILDRRYKNKRTVVIVDNAFFFDEDIMRRLLMGPDFRAMESMTMQFHLPVITAVPEGVAADYYLMMMDMINEVADGEEEEDEDENENLSDEDAETLKQIEALYHAPRTNDAEHILEHRNHVCIVKTNNYFEGRDALIDIAREFLQGTDRTVLYYSITMDENEFIVRMASAATRAFNEVIPDLPAISFDRCLELADGLNNNPEGIEDAAFRNALFYIARISEGRVRYMLKPMEDKEDITTIDDIIISIGDYIVDHPDEKVAVFIDYPLFHELPKELAWMVAGALDRFRMAHEAFPDVPIIIAKSTK